MEDNKLPEDIPQEILDQREGETKTSKIGDLTRTALTSLGLLTTIALNIGVLYVIVITIMAILKV